MLVKKVVVVLAVVVKNVAATAVVVVVVVNVLVVVNVKELRVFARLLLANLQRLDVVVGQAWAKTHLDVAFDPDLVVEKLLAADAAPAHHACSLVRLHARWVAKVSGLQVRLESVPPGEAACLVATGLGGVVVEGAVVRLGLGVLFHVAGEVSTDAELRVAVRALVDLLRVWNVVLEVVAVVLVREAVLHAGVAGVGGGVQALLGVVRLDRRDRRQVIELAFEGHAGRVGLGLAVGVDAVARARVGGNRVRVRGQLLDAVVERGGALCGGMAQLELELAPGVRQRQEHRAAGRAALLGRGWSGLLSLLLLVGVFSTASGGPGGPRVQGGEVLDELDRWGEQGICVQRRLFVTAAAGLPPAAAVAAVEDHAVDEQQGRLEERRKDILDRVEQPAETADQLGC